MRHGYGDAKRQAEVETIVSHFCGHRYGVQHDTGALVLRAGVCAQAERMRTHKFIAIPPYQVQDTWPAREAWLAKNVTVEIITVGGSEGGGI